MDLLTISSLFIFSPTEKNKKFTNVLTQNISKLAALKLVMSWQKKVPKYCCRHCGVYGKFSQSLRGLIYQMNVGYSIGQVVRLLGCINQIIVYFEQVYF